ncbi:MAG: signal peptidase I [Bacteroidia bacterium]
MSGSAIVFNAIVFLLFAAFKAGEYKLFEKAGESGWKALVPVYNMVIWARLIGKPWWWAVLCYVPIVGVLVLVAMLIELAKAYGKYSLGHHALSLLLPFVFFPRIGFAPQVAYLGPPDTHKNLPKKSGLREWGDAILFAGVAALIIRTFFVEAFMIPTSSMERTLMAGDFLFVSKFHYGSRMPMVPLAVPFVHNKIAVGGVRLPSYLDWIKLPYMRLPGLAKIKRNDIVVFNYPAHDIHDLNDGAGKVSAISLKENYIKRCVAMPGDTLEVRDQQIYINGEIGTNPPNMQYQYQVETDGTGFSRKRLNDLGFRDAGNPNANWVQMQRQVYYFWMPDTIAQVLRGYSGVKKVEIINRPAGEFRAETYPKFDNEGGRHFKFNIDNYGPIVLPRRGMTVALTPANVSLYYRPITAYEGHTLELKDGKVWIDGAAAESYTFAMDYYWMMGDNRHNSEDSRFWGFVPENHIVGRPLFVFFSYEKDFGVRWSRIGVKNTR